MNKITKRNLNYKIALLIYLSSDTYVKHRKDERGHYTSLRYCFFLNNKKEASFEDFVKMNLFGMISFLSSYQILNHVRFYIKSNSQVRSTIIDFSVENMIKLSEFVLSNTENITSLILYYDIHKVEDSLNNILSLYKEGQVYEPIYKYSLQKKLVKENLLRLSEKYYPDNIPYTFEGMEFKVCSSLVLYDLLCEGFLKNLTFVNINKSKFSYRLSMQSDPKIEHISLEGNELLYLGKSIAFKGKQLQLLQSLYKVKNQELTYLDISEKVYGDMTRNANTIYSLLTVVNNKAVNRFNLENDYLFFDSNSAVINKKYLNIKD